MNSLKTIIVDILATIFIAGAVWLHDPWMWWVIIIYTVILLIAKSFVLYANGSTTRNREHQVTSNRIMHFLYALNILLLCSADWWYVAALWALIWLLAYIGTLEN